MLLNLNPCKFINYPKFSFFTCLQSRKNFLEQRCVLPGFYQSSRLSRVGWARALITLQTLQWEMVGLGHEISLALKSVGLSTESRKRHRTSCRSSADQPHTTITSYERSEISDIGAERRQRRSTTTTTTKKTDFDNDDNNWQAKHSNYTVYHLSTPCTSRP